MRVFPLFLLVAAAVAQTPEVRLNRVVSGLTNPDTIAFSPDGTGRMFVVEQQGRIRLLKNGQLLTRPFLDWRSRVSCCGERGLLGLAFPPGFATKQYFYINYTDPQGNTAVSRIRVSADADLADAASEERILSIVQPFENHNGGGLAFSPKDGYLYIGTGDGGSAGDPQRNGQNLNTLLGKMLRIDVESSEKPYRVPPDNPFVGRQGARPEIWAIGLRNPWRYAFDRDTSDLWIADVGQGRAEEVNLQPASSKGGENYGWNITEGRQCYPPGSSCDQTGLTAPILEYSRTEGISVTGGYVYRGKRFPALQGIFLYGDYGTGNLWGVRANGSNQLLLAPKLAITAFGEDENGELYLADYSKGDIYSITAGKPATTAGSVVNAASFGGGLVPGSLATVFGTGITALPGIVGAERVPLPTDLAGISVSLNGVQVPLIAAASANGQEQINFQVPWELAGASTASLVINVNGQSSNAVDIPITAMQPEIFSVTRSANGLTLWATGLGRVTNQPSTGQAATAATAVSGSLEVLLDGTPLTVTFAGLPTQYVGLYQINVTTPANATGEISIRMGSAVSRPLRISN